jgi:dTDP-4-dehydrorhamnose reductase
MGSFAGNILITGSRGQLGCELMRSLSSRYQVLGVTHVDLDITDDTEVMAYLKTVKPSVVIHCAAWTDVDACESDPAKAIAVNADGTRHIARACHEIGAVMCYYSTDYVFDGMKTSPYVEEDATNPRTVYGKSKLAGEMFVSSIVERHIILRVGWIYGGGKNFVNTMIDFGRRQVSSDQRGVETAPIRVVNDQTGCPTWTKDIVRQTEEILSRQLFGLYHAANGGATTWYDLARRIFDQLRMPVEVIPCTSAEFGRSAPRPLYSVMENRRLNAAQCNVMPDYRESLKSFLEGSKGTIS